MWRSLTCAYDDEIKFLIWFLGGLGHTHVLLKLLGVSLGNIMSDRGQVV